jgi:hypothetical protein
MRHRVPIALVCLLAGTVSAYGAEEVVIDFEQAEIGKPTPEWTEKGVVFKLSGAPTRDES